ncbi:MAG: peptidylprolyl isomerase, partial [Gemmatimonadetes bacterium]|nr:peptidylprolyl isomerase [Gemmatimonadota bacterium]
MRIRLLALAVIVPTALVAACSNEPTEGVVARVGDHSLTVDDVVDLLVDQEEFPPQADVVAAIIDLWVDYTLLGEAVMDDTTFSGLDLEALVRQAENASMIARLRDSVIQVATFITNDELQARYEAEAPDLELRARHVMLTLPLQATDAQRDSVRGQLENLRDRIVSGGESFVDVARTFSQDIGSASNGGDLGFFGRGEMVQPFEEAVLALELGEVSQIVETPMGLHLIQLDERRTQDFDDIASDFRTREQARSYITAESTFVVQLEERAQPEVMDEAVEVVRELARNPDTRLSGRAERRPLVSWEVGEYSVVELQLLIRIEPQAMREQLI